MRLRWEPFSPVAVGYDVLSAHLTEFYADAPWNEYLKCPQCAPCDDFGPVAAFGREEATRLALRTCPGCGTALTLFWSAERVEAYLGQLALRGRLMGTAVFDESAPAGWIWGYEIGEGADARYGDGVGMYVDVICIPPVHRNGIVAWYLILTTLMTLLESGHKYIVSRTHVEAETVRTLFRRLGFTESEPSGEDPQRSYWWRRLDDISGDVLAANYRALTAAAARARPAEVPAAG